MLDILYFWWKLLSFNTYILKISQIFFSYLPSKLKITIYRQLGAKIGNNVEIGFGSIIIPSGLDFYKIHIDDNVIIEDYVTILAKELSLHRGAQIKCNTKIWGQSKFFMGRGSYIDQHCLLDLRHDISLGDFAGIGADSWLYTHGVWHSILTGAPSNFGPIVIQERAWVAANVFIMPNIMIGKGSIVGARSVVTKNVEPDSVVAGNPAREINRTSNITKKLSFDEKCRIISNILVDFNRVYDNSILQTNQYTDSEIIYYKNSILIYQSLINENELKKIINGNISNIICIISFIIPINVREYCEQKGLIFFDINEGIMHGKNSKYSNLFRSFFGNYGIQFERKY